MTSFLSYSDIKEIETAVKEAEKKTTGEFVTVVVCQSASYMDVPLIAAFIIVFLVTAFVGYFYDTQATFYRLGILHFPVLWIGFCQLVIASITFFIFNIRAIKMSFISESRKQREACSQAHAQFWRLGLHLTKDRTGVLLFVSVAERYAEIIADHGIHEKVGARYWQTCINDFVSHVKRGDIKKGFISAVEKINQALIHHFPGKGKNINERPDRLIQLF